MLLKTWLLPFAFMVITGYYAEARHLPSLKEEDYWTRRKEIIDDEASFQLGSSITLNDDEERVNKILMHYKLADLDAAFDDPSKYLPGRHFFETRISIKNSEIFKLLRKMPKGGLLHTHSTATTSFDYNYDLTKMDNLYVCRDEKSPKLMFFSSPDDKCNWELVSALRASEGNEFEKYLVEHMTLIREDHEDVFTDINKVWSTFQNLFSFSGELITYMPVLKDHFRETIQQLYDDNITYLEMRGTLSWAYDLNGTTFTPEELVQMHIDIAEEFKAAHPDFIGVKMIYSPSRRVDDATFDSYVKTAESLKAKFPDFISGFDLVGQEDLGRPLKDYVDKLRNMDMDFYFHAGETNWNQGLTDQNLIDAVLLGTKRIGHGYGAIKHPYVIEQAVEKGIAFEVSPISNQVLMLVRDLRNHPGSIFMADNIPMVITNDDPTFWGAEGVSYDWYMAFMGMASRNADLRLLKQLAINSLEYSSLRGEEKKIALSKWSNDWDKFIANTLQENRHVL